MSDDHLSLAYQAHRCLENYAGDKRRAANAMGMTLPTFNRHLSLLDLPADFIAAYRKGKLSRTLLWKLPRQPRETLIVLLGILQQNQELKHSDLNALKGESEALMERFRATARKLKKGGMSNERLYELVRQA